MRWPARGLASGVDAYPQGSVAEIVPARNVPGLHHLAIDPDTGMRDLSIPDTLLRSFGHANCGVYGEVVEAGDIARGDDLGS